MVLPGPAHVAGAHTRAGNAMGRTRRGLLDGAARAFAANGLRAATMQSIAAAAGVAKATLYNHFRTKDEVARALLAAELDRLEAVVARRPADAALAVLSDEVAGHPVLQRLRETDPDVLLSLLATPRETWAELTRRLGVALGVDADAAELPARWLLGVALQPGRSGLRHRSAARIAAVLTTEAAAGHPERSASSEPG